MKNNKLGILSVFLVVIGGVASIADTILTKRNQTNMIHEMVEKEVAKKLTSGSEG